MAIYPSVGLVWFSPLDPTVAPGISAPYGQFLIRTDEAGLYWKSGPLATDWSRIGVGSAATGFHNSGYFGDGGDGDKTVVGNETLTRDMAYNTLLVPVGTSLNTNGFRVFVRGTAVIDGRLHCDGNAGLANGTAGATAGPNGTLGQGKAGGAGGGASGAAAGSTNAAAPRFYTQGSATTGGTVGPINTPGGNGASSVGTGGAGAGGGSGGTTTGAGVAAGASGGGVALSTFSSGDIRSMPQIFNGRQASGSSLFDAGAGGGGGARGTTTADRGGGGGGGGGVVGFYPYHLSGAGFISARGGDGGTPTAFGAGGGGAGGGGLILLVNALSGSSTPTLQVTPGAAGNGGPSDATRFAGGRGGNGVAGQAVTFNIGQ